MPIRKLEPKSVWNNFYSLTQIPRPSGHTKAVADFLVKFGKNLGLESFKDECGNVIICKPATKGMEDRKTIILQAHMDMVPQKNNETKHDFTKDPIIPRIVKHEDGDWVHATGTTLGADDGLGVAAAMAVLESKTIKHGPIEALFTVDEETRMVGAKALSPKTMHGDILLNLDSETEGELYVGCAGGLDANVTFKYKTAPMPKGYKAFRVIVGGLRGGHSGMEINEGRGNANKVMARALLPIISHMKGKLVSFDGGNMRNAIPREAEAVIAIPAEMENSATKSISHTQAIIRAELAKIDPNVTVAFEPAKAKNVMAGTVGKKLIMALYACPNSVDRMSLEMEGLVESSNNLAIVKTEKGKFVSSGLMRGATDSIKYDQAEALRCAFELAGGKVVFEGAYSGWAPNLASPILKTMKEQYKKLYKVEPAVMAIHAGLECGLFAGKLPGLDAVSLGATMANIHSSRETMFVSSMQRTWKLVTDILARLR